MTRHWQQRTQVRTSVRKRRAEPGLLCFAPIDRVVVVVPGSLGRALRRITIGCRRFF